MRGVAILTAAGSGNRLGNALPKALVTLGGIPLVRHAVLSLAAANAVEQVIITAPNEHLAAVEALFPGGVVSPPAADVASAPTVEGPSADVPVTVVAGGPTRQASVAAALATISRRTDRLVVLVHDAARPLAPATLVQRVARAVRDGADAVVPGLPVTDTIKQVHTTADGGLLVVATPERSTLRAVQTPQGFEHTLLLRAHRAAQDRGHDEARAVSDDAGLVELLGEPVRLVPGDPRAMKITTRDDLEVAERWLSRS